MYILRAIVMLFLHAKVIPVNPQIHANVMRPLCDRYKYMKYKLKQKLCNMHVLENKLNNFEDNKC
jgi:hypothetical protein